MFRLMDIDRAIRLLQQTISEGVHTMSTTLSAIQSAQAALDSSVKSATDAMTLAANNIAALTAQLQAANQQNNGGLTTAEVTGLIGDLNTQAAALQSAAQALTAVEPATPAPAPPAA